MAQGYDADVQLSVGLSLEDVTDQARDIANEVEKVFDKMDSSKMTNQMKKLSASMSRTESQIQSTMRQIDSLQEKYEGAMRWTELREQLQPYVDELQRLSEMRDAVAPDVRRMKEIELQMDAVREESRALTDEMLALEEAGNNTFTPQDADKLDNFRTKLGDLNNQQRLQLEQYSALERAQQRSTEGTQEQIREATVQNQSIVNLVNRYRELGRQIEQMTLEQQQLNAQGIGPGHLEFDRLTRSIAEARRRYEELGTSIQRYNERQAESNRQTSNAQHVLGLVGRGASQAGRNFLQLVSTTARISPVGREVGKLTSKVNMLTSSLTKCNKANGNFDNSLKNTLKKILSYGIGIASLTALFNKLRGAIKSGINNLVQVNGGLNSTNQAISSMMSSLNALKNAWGAAFAPILTKVAPMLTRLIDMLTNVVNRISMFMASITGQTTTWIAKKTDYNYADSLKGSGSSSEDKYNEAVKKAQEKYEKDLAKIREKNAKALAKAQEQQAKAAEKLAKQQEKANKQLGTYDKLNVIAKQDEEELQEYQAEQYEEPNLEDYLPNPEDYASGGTDFNAMFEEVPVESAISDFVQRIKDAWEKTDFTEIGNIVGQKLKETTDNLTSWLVDVAQPLAEKLGKSLGTFINGLTQTEGLADSLGTAIGEGLNTIVDAINGFFDSVDWNQLGTFLAEGLNGLVNSIDWEELGHMLIMKWNALFETLLGFVDTFDFKKLGDGIAKGFTKIIEDFDMKSLTGSISGLVAGLLETISGFLQEVNWYKMGHTLFEKVKDAIVGIEWGRLFTAIFEVLGSALGAFWALLGGLIIAITKLVLKAWDDFVKWFKGIAFEDGKFVIEGLLQGIWEVIKNIGKWIYDHILKPFVDGFKKAFGIASPSKVMIELAGLLMDGLKKGITDKINAVITTFNTIKTKIVTVFNSIKTTVLNIWNGLWTSVKNIISRAWSGIKSVINTILGGVERMANGIVKGLNKAIDAINTLSFDVPDWVPEVGGKSIGLNIPNLSEISIPKLATGAVIPPNKQFLAMLGDQKSGTNIEAPLDTIVQAFKKVLDDEDTGNNPIILQLDGKTVAEVVWDEETKRYKQRGSYRPSFS